MNHMSSVDKLSCWNSDSAAELAIIIIKKQQVMSAAAEGDGLGSSTMDKSPFSVTA